MPDSAAKPADNWGVKNEYGKLTDVLLCAPDHFE